MKIIVFSVVFVNKNPWRSHTKLITYYLLLFTFQKILNAI